MKALISKIEPVESGYRVAQVEQDDAIFDVAEGLEWISCPDEIVADRFWFDPLTRNFNPILDIYEIQAAANQPSSSGAETL